ncbi:hypothetical protein DFH29DRAFT_1008237 [Suillus ampliporus]|nr:hypothetical protein DFH29DRAFT_1008237 [Suillus ampliporus]
MTVESFDPLASLVLSRETYTHFASSVILSRLSRANLAALEEWKKAEEARKQRNRELTGKYQMELERWKEEKERAKMEKRRLAWKKPTRGKLEAPLPEPVVAEGTAGDGLDVDEDEHEPNASDEGEEE